MTFLQNLHISPQYTADPIACASIGAHTGSNYDAAALAEAAGGL